MLFLTPRCHMGRWSDVMGVVKLGELQLLNPDTHCHGANGKSFTVSEGRVFPWH